MDTSSEMRVKLARFIEQRRGRTDATNIICNSCLELGDEIAIEGDGYEWSASIVSEGLSFTEHSSCEGWMRLSLWLQGVLEASHVPWNQMLAEVKRRVNLFVENEWRYILFLMEEEMVNMTREIIFCDWHDFWRSKQRFWEKIWRNQMV